MRLLVALLMTWLSSNFDLPTTQDHPSIQFTTSPQLALLRYGAIASAGGNEPVAVYHDAARTVYLPDNWSGQTPAEVSVLVHELVHHLQNVGAFAYYCPAAREALAYEAQDRWLKLFGTDLENEFGIDAMTLKLRAACM